MTSPRVLIVDDDDAIRQTFAKALELEGFHVSSAASSFEALRDMRDADPDAILLDLQMPFINGLGFLYRLRANPASRDIPVVIITGSTKVNAEMIAESGELGADIKFKPMWIDEMLEITRALVARNPRRH